jgi:cell division septum initiation protein DivIVA
LFSARPQSHINLTTSYEPNQHAKVQEAEAKMTELIANHEVSLSAAQQEAADALKQMEDAHVKAIAEAEAKQADLKRSEAEVVAKLNGELEAQKQLHEEALGSHKAESDLIANQLSESVNTLKAEKDAIVRPSLILFI